MSCDRESLNWRDAWWFAFAVFVLVLCFLVFATHAEAQSSSWIGTQDANWLNPSNWNNGLPSSDALIDTSAPHTTALSGPAGPVANVTVGATGTGSLEIENGGTLRATSGVLAGGPGSSGTVTVVGVGSSWSVGGIRVGIGGIGNLVIQNGGAVSGIADGTIAESVGSIGLVIVDGAGATWMMSGAVFVGQNGSGTLTVNQGAIVSAASVQLASGAGSGTLNIGAAVGQGAVAPGTLDTPRVQFGSGTSTIVFNHTADNYVFAPVIAGSGSVDIRAGTTIFSASSSYSGPTTVNGGALVVDGSIASSSALVNSGGTLGGSGILGNTSVNGGTLAPGGATATLTVQGNLGFTAASTYRVEVQPSSAARTNVSGTATLGGATLGADFAPGSYVARQYTVLNAAGGVTGSFGMQANTNLPAGFVSSLSYDANNVFLNLALEPLSGGNTNQRNVSAGLSNSFNAAGGIPLVFGTLSAAGLTQVSGEAATGSQQTTFNAMSLFMGILTDPFVAGRTNAASDAYGMIGKVTPHAASFAPGWSVWGAGYGGAQSTDGNASLGSHDVTARVFGTVVGADYRFAPDTLAGFAVAGGGTSFGIADGLGGGRSDLFQAGAYMRHTEQAAYITGALAYGWQQIDTDRTMTVAGLERLHAQFNANAFSGRVEAGYRFAVETIGLTPYAAAQLTSFGLPSYAESTVAGSNMFALRYDARDITASRGELGLRADTSFVLTEAVLRLRGRAGWTYDFNSDRTSAAAFQALPVASFTVNGAAQPRNLALTSASAEWLWSNGVSLAATFEGEFSGVSTSVAAKGVVRYQW